MFAIFSKLQLKRLKKRGLKIRTNVSIQNDVSIDVSHAHLITIGNHVIIGASSVVSKDIKAHSVAVGNPAKIIMTYEQYKEKNEQLFMNSPVYESTWQSKKINSKQKEQMKEILKDKIGYII